MHCKVLGHEGRNDLIIYLDKQERQSSKTNELLTEMKKQCENIIIFTSGEESFEDVISKLIRDRHANDISTG